MVVRLTVTSRGFQHVQLFMQSNFFLNLRKSLWWSRHGTPSTNFISEHEKGNEVVSIQFLTRSSCDFTLNHAPLRYEAAVKGCPCLKASFEYQILNFSMTFTPFWCLRLFASCTFGADFTRCGSLFDYCLSASFMTS